MGDYQEVFVIITTKNRACKVFIGKIKAETQENAAHSRTGMNGSAQSEQIAVSCGEAFLHRIKRVPVNFERKTGFLFSSRVL